MIPTPFCLSHRSFLVTCYVPSTTGTGQAAAESSSPLEWRINIDSTSPTEVDGLDQFLAIIGRLVDVNPAVRYTPRQLLDALKAIRDSNRGHPGRDPIRPSRPAVADPALPATAILLRTTYSAGPSVTAAAPVVSFIAPASATSTDAASVAGAGLHVSSNPSPQSQWDTALESVRSRVKRLAQIARDQVDAARRRSTSSLSRARCLSDAIWDSLDDDSAIREVFSPTRARELNVLGSRGHTPLINAIRKGFHGTVAALLLAGANLMTESRFGDSSLGRAADAANGTLEVLLNFELFKLFRFLQLA